MGTTDPALPFLEDALDGVAFTKRAMFGHVALFAAGNIFAVAWEGKPALKLRDAAVLARAMAIRGATPFDPGRDGKGMSQWVVLPEELFDEPATLAELARAAHAGALAAPPKARRARAARTNSKASKRSKRSKR